MEIFILSSYNLMKALTLNFDAITSMNLKLKGSAENDNSKTYHNVI